MNRNFNSKSIILTRRPLGEKNLLVKLFAEQFGLLDVVAYGAQSMNSKLRTVNTIGMAGTAYLYRQRSKSLGVLREFEPDVMQRAVGNRIYYFLYHSLWTEVLIATFGSGSEYQRGFALLHAGLAALRSCVTEAHHRLATARFLWRYLRLNGVSPELTRCAACAEPLAAEQELIYAHARVYCPRCYERIVAKPGAEWSGAERGGGGGAIPHS